MRRRNHLGGYCLGAVALMLSLGLGCASSKPPQQGRSEPIVLVVMDPLAKELACACVKGYGQRDYRKLAAHLQKAVKQQVKVEFRTTLPIHSLARPQLTK